MICPLSCDYSVLLSGTRRLILRAVGLDHLADALAAEGAAVRAARAAHAQDAVAAAHDQRVHLLDVAEEAQPLHSEPRHGVLFSTQESAEAPDLRPAKPNREKERERERKPRKEYKKKKKMCVQSRLKTLFYKECT